MSLTFVAEKHGVQELTRFQTTFFERVLVGAMHGPPARDFSYIIGAKSLKEALKLYADKPKYQQLVVPFERGEDPDDAYSTVPYDKGANMLLVSDLGK